MDQELISVQRAMDTALRDKEAELTTLTEEKLRIATDLETVSNQLLEAKNSENNNIDFSAKTQARGILYEIYNQ